MKNKIILLVTTSSLLEAKELGRKLIEERLASCVNCWEGVDSIFWWKGKMEEAEEGILLVKTTERLKKATIARIKELHSYESPSIIDL